VKEKGFMKHVLWHVRERKKKKRKEGRFMERKLLDEKRAFVGSKKKKDSKWLMIVCVWY
jgi:hypothetical protein